MKVGQRITLSFEGREFDVIVIDPNGLGEGQPSVGFGYRMMELHAGLPASTLSTWAFDKDGVTYLKLPSSKELRVFDILGSDNNNYKVVEAYVALKGVYTEKDSRATTRWLEERQLGKITRKLYTDLLQAQGCKDYDYAYWTDYIYTGLFGMKASEMKSVWDLVDGDPNIARNYIPKAEGLEAVKYCEDMVVRVFVDDLQEAHDLAINLTKRKFLGGA
uniref:Uncharacterized protein n=1 Tax=Johanseniella sp. A1345 TaxID=380087 RepID=A4L7C5_9NOST|nr:hypothetical protein [Johanseniella A1345]